MTKAQKLRAPYYRPGRFRASVGKLGPYFLVKLVKTSHFWRFGGILVTSLAMLWTTPAAAHQQGCDVEVVRVIDGDSLVVRSVTLLGGPGVLPLFGVSHLRLLRVDTPERSEPGFERARSITERLVKGGIGITVPGPRARDSFGRFLAEVHVCLQQNGSQVTKSLNDILRSEGWTYGGE